LNKGAFGQVTIVGSGLLGHAIGLVHALGGCRVTLHDLDEATLDQALELARLAGDVLVEVGAHDRKSVDNALQQMATEVDLAKALQGADLIVEAITEKADAKREIFARIDQHAPQQAIIASNTSYLDIFPLLPERRRSRALIVHWYTPPYAIDLVDVVKGPQTEPGLAEAMCSFLRGLGKNPILLPEFLSGYIANRIQTAISLEAFHLIDSGLATAEMIDTAIKYGLAERLALLGHLKRIDFTGLKVTQLNLANKAYSPPALRGRSDAVDRLVCEGKLGVATGQGFYDYDETSTELLRNRDRKLFALKHALNEIGRD
jgi:3-hydroxybutyryl-CoA dehydrogenase